MYVVKECNEGGCFQTIKGRPGNVGVVVPDRLSLTMVEQLPWSFSGIRRVEARSVSYSFNHVLRHGHPSISYGEVCRFLDNAVSVKSKGILGHQVLVHSSRS